MDVIKSFVLDGTTYEVHMIWKDGEPLFKAADIGTVLGLKNIRVSLESLRPHEKVVSKVYTLGGPQDVTFLTEPAMYKIINRSHKPIAQRFQDWVADVIVNIRKTGSYQLKNLEEELRRANDDKEAAVRAALASTVEQHDRDKRRSIHDALVTTHSTGPLVYVGYIRPDADAEGRTLIKIGSTIELKTRVQSLARECGNVDIFHVFKCTMYRDFERYLQKHRDVEPLRYDGDVVPNHRSNGEVFSVTQDELEHILNIGKRNIRKFVDEVTRRELDEEHQRDLEIERLRQETERLRLDRVHGETLLDKQIELERLRLARETLMATAAVATTSNDAADVMVDQDARRYTQARGDKIQLYTPDGSKLVRTYAGWTDATRDADLDSPSPSMIKHAIAERTVYKGYRWASLDRRLPDDTVQDIGDTVDGAHVRRGLVAMLDLDGSRIVRVFCDQKAAAQNRKFNGVGAISKAIDKGTKSGGHLFRMWVDCSDELRADLIAREGPNALPAPRETGRGRPVERLDPRTGDVLERYASVARLLKVVPMGRESLKKAILGNYVFKRNKWRFAGPQDDDDVEAAEDA